MATSLFFSTNEITDSSFCQADFDDDDIIIRPGSAQDINRPYRLIYPIPNADFDGDDTEAGPLDFEPIYLSQVRKRSRGPWRLRRSLQPKQRRF